ncbi:hypothetical protein ACB094_11G145600 [Castanea mollissima]
MFCQSDEVARIWKERELDLTLNESIAAIEAWGKLGKVEEAEAVFEMMLQKWKKLSSRPYNALLKVYMNHKLLTKWEEFVKRMGDSGCWVGPLAWDALVRIYLGAGDVEKADTILHKAAQHSSTGMKHCRHSGQLKQFEILIRAYINTKSPVYGFRERMKAENMFPNKAFAQLLAQVDAFRER